MSEVYPAEGARLDRTVALAILLRTVSAGSDRVARVVRLGAAVLCLLCLATPLSAQDLDPRSYANAPVNVTFLVSGLWLFTANGSFYPGTSLRKQAPMGALQMHLSYSFRRQLWAAFDATYYAGGQTTVDGVNSNDRQSNSRVGATVVLPVGQRHSVKLAVSRGAIVRYGADFSTISIGWQTGWVPRPTSNR